MQNYHLFSDGAQWTLTREGSDHSVGTFATRLEGVMSCCQFLRRREGSLQLHAPATSGGARRNSSRAAARGIPRTAPLDDADFVNTSPAAMSGVVG